MRFSILCELAIKGCFYSPQILSHITILLFAIPQTIVLARMLCLTLSLLALSGLSLGAPSQEPITFPVKAKDSPEFPIPPPLPFNGTIPGVDYDLIAKLKTSPNAITRIALLKDSDFAFDFISPPKIPGIEFKGEGGFFVNAQGLSMPALIENGMSLSVAFTKPWYEAKSLWKFGTCCG